MRRFIPYGKQDIDESDVQAVISTLKSDFLTQGPAVQKFENDVAAFCGARHAVAVTNATAGLHLACMALGLGEGDELWTSPITFAASANAARYCGARVDFVDIDAKTLNLCPGELKKKLEAAAHKRKLPRVLVPVHFTGEPAEMEEISRLCRSFGVAVVEDAAHAIGAEYRGIPIGSCAASDMTVFSFHPVKVITTGEGGIITTNRPELHDKLVLYRSHGITRREDLLENESHGGWYYEQLGLGFNFRLTDIQSALGSSQLRRLPEFLKVRHELATRYDLLLRDLPLKLPYRSPDSYSGLHLYVVQIDEGKTSITRKELYDALVERGIGVNVHYIPVHFHPYYRNLGFKKGMFPYSEAYYRNAITLPLFPGLTQDEQNYVAETVRSILA